MPRIRYFAALALLLMSPEAPAETQKGNAVAFANGTRFDSKGYRYPVDQS
jgi:hypothetical protein